MLKYASIKNEILVEKRVGEAEFLSGFFWTIVASLLRDCKTSAYVFSLGFFGYEKIFFINTQFMIGISGM